MYQIAITETVRHNIVFQVVDEITAMRAWQWDNLLLMLDPDKAEDVLSARRILAEHHLLPSKLARALMHTIAQLTTNSGSIIWDRFEEATLKQITAGVHHA